MRSIRALYRIYNNEIKAGNGESIKKILYGYALKKFVDFLRLLLKGWTACAPEAPQYP